MSSARHFMAWQRVGLGAKSARMADGSYATSLTLRYGSDTDDVDLPLWGPGQVAGLQDRAFTKQVPAAGSGDATPGSLAYVEFSDPHLPWALPFDDETTPWLALLCLPADTARIDVGAQPGPMIVFEGDPAPYLPDADLIRALAHLETQDGAAVSARLLAPTQLMPGVAYLCAIVPTSAAGRAAGLGEDHATATGLAWGDGTAPAQLPAYAHWTFRCGTIPSFEDVVAKLSPVPDPGTRLNALTSPDTDNILGLAAPAPVALRTVFAPPGEIPAAPAKLAQAIAKRLETRDDRPEGLGLPAYGRGARRSQTVPWFDNVNTDPGLRLAAGLGARVAAAHRDHIADFATAQVGALDAVNALLARARAAGYARRATWSRLGDHISTGRAAEVLAIAAPGLRRTAHAQADDPQPFTERLGRSTAAVLADPATRLALRGDLARKAGGRGSQSVPPAQPDPTAPNAAAPLDAVLGDHVRETSNGRIPGGKLTRTADARFSGSEVQTPVPDGDPLRAIDQMRDNVLPQMQDTPPGLGTAREALEEASDRRRRATGRRPRLDRPDALAHDVHAALYPAATIRSRVAARIDLHPDIGPLTADLEQITWEPPWPRPLVDLLTELSPDLVTPAAQKLKADQVTLLETDMAMIEAVIVGANHAALADLRWRDFPLRPDMSPVRRVFPRARIAGTAHDALDAPPVRIWDTSLGRNSRAQGGSRPPPKSVLLIRSALFDLYPDTLLYAVPAQRQGDGMVPSPVPGQRAFPVAFGSLGRGLTYVGFTQEPDTLSGADGGDGWFIIFQGPDTAGGFSLPRHGPAPSWETIGGQALTSTGLPNAADASAVAQALLDRPLTVALHASRLLEAPSP